MRRHVSVVRLFADLSISKKLYGLGGGLVALLVLTGVLAIANLSSAASQSRDMYQNATVPIERLDAVRGALGNVDSDLLRALSATTGTAQIASAVQADSEAVQRALAAYHGSSLSGSEQQVYSRFESLWPQYTATGASVLKLALQGTTDGHRAATSLYYAKAGAENNRLDQLAVQLITINDAQASAAARNVNSSSSSSRTTTIIVLVLSVLFGVGLAFAVSRSIKRNVVKIMERLEICKVKGADRLTEVLRALAQGDLTDEVVLTTTAETEFPGDELGQIQRMVEEVRAALVVSLNSYNDTRTNLIKIVGGVSGSAGQVSAASQEMAATSDESGRATSEIAHAIGDIAHGAERQVQMIESARNSADEIGHAVNEAAENAQRTAEVAHQAREIAQQGVGAADQANEAMRSVRDSSSDVSEAIGELASKSEQIGKIVETITGIAEQTNLLALNAAIEAARAGEQGRGFAVVAEEVRKLAEDSQSAAHEISGLIGAIQTETRHAVAVVESGSKRTADGVAVVERTREAFQQIGSSVDDITGRIEQIAAVSQQIAASAQSLQANIGEVAAVAEQSSASTQEVSASTEQSSASAEQIAASAQELSGNAETLNRLMSQFKLTT